MYDSIIYARSIVCIHLLSVPNQGYQMPAWRRENHRKSGQDKRQYAALRDRATIVDSV